MRDRWSVYMVRCSDGTLYTGIAKDLARRIREHNRGKGCRYTRGRRPVLLQYCEELPDRSSALKREAVLKSWRRRRKLHLIRRAREVRRAPAAPSC